MFLLIFQLLSILDKDVTYLSHCDTERVKISELVENIQKRMKFPVSTSTLTEKMFFPGGEDSL